MTALYLWMDRLPPADLLLLLGGAWALFLAAAAWVSDRIEGRQRQWKLSHLGLLGGAAILLLPLSLTACSSRASTTQSAQVARAGSVPGGTTEDQVLLHGLQFNPDGSVIRRTSDPILTRRCTCLFLRVEDGDRLPREKDKARAGGLRPPADPKGPAGIR